MKTLKRLLAVLLTFALAFSCLALSPSFAIAGEAGEDEETPIAVSESDGGDEPAILSEAGEGGEEPAAGEIPVAAFAGETVIQPGLPAISANTTLENTTKIGLNGKQWLVVGYNGAVGATPPSTVSTLTLLLANGYDYGPSSFGSNNTYSGSTLQSAMDTILNGMKELDRACISPRALNDVSPAVASAYIWPLSEIELGYLTYPLRAFTSGFYGHWWLRSPVLGDAGRAWYYYGSATAVSVTTNSAARPATLLRTSDILFTSPAVGGKSGGPSATLSPVIPLPAGTPIKFTCQADASALSLTCTNPEPRVVRWGDTISMSYNNVKPGTDRSVSCVIVNSGDETLYYGKLAQAAGAAGTVTFTVPDESELPPGNYEIKLFCEELNGDNQLDFCSAPVSIPMTVTAIIDGTLTDNPTIVGFGGKQWALIGNEGAGVASAPDTMTFLLAKNQSYGTSRFDSNMGIDNKYSDSILRSAMNNLAGGIEGPEADLIKARDLEDVEVTGAGFWPLSITEANALRAEVRKFDTGSCWWLRSQTTGSVYSSAPCVFGDSGDISSTGFAKTFDYGVRPAFCMDLDVFPLKYTNTATGGKTSAVVGAGLIEITKPASTEAISFTFTDISVPAPGLTFHSHTNNSATIVFGFTGAEEGTNRYVSCALEQGGEIKYYGKYADCENTSAGMIVLPVKDIAAGEYELKIYSEYSSGENYSSFDGLPASMTLTVDNDGKGSISGFGGTVLKDPAKFSIALDPKANKDFGTKTLGYSAQDAHSVTINNTGNTWTGPLTIELSGPGASGFSLSATEADGIVPSGNSSFTVSPKEGLAPGTYQAVVKVAGGSGISASFNVSFKVNSYSVYYVKTDGDDRNNGNTWGAAFATLQRALDAALARDTIRVAEGIYLPSRKAAEADYAGAQTTERDMAFVLKKDVRLYGGYNAATGARDIKKNETVLSGDLGDPGDPGDNAYHVLIMPGDPGGASLDGFTIENGNADGDGYIVVNGVDIYRSHGGGLRGAGVALSNCVFRDNSAIVDAGAVYNYGTAALFTDCVFTGNTAGNSGGAVYNHACDSVFINCLFSGNSASTINSSFGGGALCLALWNPVVIGCVFYGNSAEKGGGLYNYQSNAKIVNSTFSGNTAGAAGSELYNFDGNSFSAFINSIVVGSCSGGGPFSYTTSIAGGNYYMNDAEYSAVDTGKLFAGGTDLRLADGSPAIDKGTYPVAGVSLPASDLGGRPRVTGGVIDLGAYEWEPTNFLRITPPHAIIADPDDTVVLTAELPPGYKDNGSIEWSASPAGAVGFNGTADEAADGMNVTVKAKDLVPKTVLIKAEFQEGEKVYTATAAVEILSDKPAADDGKTIVELLDKAVTVNRARTDGAPVPVLITQQDRGQIGKTPIGISAFGASSAGTPVLGAMRLVDKNGKGLENFSVSTRPGDSRYIEIKALNSKAKTTKNVSLQILPVDAPAPALPLLPMTAAQRTAWDNEWNSSAGRMAAKGTINVTVTNSYPKLTIKAESLNLGFPTLAMPLTVKSAAGVPVELRSMSGAAADKIEMDSGNRTLSLALDPDRITPKQKKKVTLKGKLTVQQQGYSEQTVNFSVKVIASTMPNVKLDRKSVSLHYPGAPPAGGVTAADLVPVNVSLIPAAKKAVFEDRYKVKDIEVLTANANLDAAYIGGEKGLIELTAAGPVPKKVVLRVIFEDPADPAGKTKFRNLSLNVSMVKAGNLKPSNKGVSVNVNKELSGMGAGSIELATVKIVPNAHNIALSDWGIIGTPARDTKSKTPAWGENGLHDWHGALSVTPGSNVNEIKIMADKEKLAKLIEEHESVPANTSKNMKYTLRIGSGKLNASAGKATGKEPAFSVTLNVVKSAASFSVSLDKKTKVDTVNPSSSVKATVKLSNTTSRIAEVYLYESRGKTSALAPDESVPHPLLEAVPTGPLTFVIKPRAAGNGLKPGLRNDIAVKIVLENGQTLTSWTEVTKMKNGVPVTSYSDKLVSVTPVQTLQKGWKAQAALYKAHPLAGSAIGGLTLKTPSNAEVSSVQIDQAKLKNLRFATPAPAGAIQGDPGVILANDGKLYTLTDGFELIRSGESEYTLYFKDGLVPTKVFDKKLKKVSNTKGSYNIYIQIRAVGTTKPSVVTVKVFLR